MCGAILVASSHSFTMDLKKSLFMPIIKTTEEAHEFIKSSRCSFDSVCRHSIEDAILRSDVCQKVGILRNVFAKLYFKSADLNETDFKNLCSDLHLSLAWLTLLKGTNRDFGVAQLTAYCVFTGNQELIQLLELHGFKANRLPRITHEELQREASKHGRRSFTAYVASLENPREYNIEEC